LENRSGNYLKEEKAMERYATMDLGTNSMRLFLGELKDGSLVYREKHVNITRIGKSVDAQGRISERGMEENLAAFITFVEQARAFGAKEIWAMATSAVRDAENGHEFVQRAFDATGVKIEIIPGSLEALLGYEGIKMAFPGLETMTMIDIGGGSTEFFTAKGDEVLYRHSFNVGALRMTERFVTTDPIAQNEWEEMQAAIKGMIGGPLGKLKAQGIQTLIGIGGTATTLAAMDQALAPYDADRVHGYEISYGSLLTLQERLARMTVAARKALKGLQPKRADVILAGITILIVAMESLGVTRLLVSEYDNLEGWLAYQLENEGLS